MTQFGQFQIGPNWAMVLKYAVRAKNWAIRFWGCYIMCSHINNAKINIPIKIAKKDRCNPISYFFTLSDFDGGTDPSSSAYDVGSFSPIGLTSVGNEFDNGISFARMEQASINDKWCSSIKCRRRIDFSLILIPQIGHSISSSSLFL